MDGVVQCPVCTLFLHPGMNLDEHLNTHPKDQVIQALTQLTLQRANILTSSQTSQFVVKTESTTAPPPPSASAIPPPAPPPAAIVAPPQIIPGTSLCGNGQRGSEILTAASPLSPQSAPQAVMIQMSPSQSQSTSPAQMFNKQSSISYVHDSQKNVMIVNSCSTQYIQQRVPSSEKQPVIKIPYGETPIQIVPRYTSERYSGPPPPYSTAISSSVGNHLTTTATGESSTSTIVCSSTENSSSSFVESNKNENISSTPTIDQHEQLGIVMPTTSSTQESIPTIQKPTPSGLKVLSNVKIPMGMINPDIKEILLNKKGKRTSKISNRKHTTDDPISSPEAPTPPASSSSSTTATLSSHIMDLSFDTPSNSQSKVQGNLIQQQQQQQEIFVVTELPSEDVAKFEEVSAEIEEERSISATPTSVIRTTCSSESPQPSTSSQIIENEKPNHSVQPTAPNVDHNSTPMIKSLGKPIVSRPKKLTLKLKKTPFLPVVPEIRIKQEPRDVDNKKTDSNEQIHDDEFTQSNSCSAPVKIEHNSEPLPPIAGPSTVKAESDSHVSNNFIITYVNAAAATTTNTSSNTANAITNSKDNSEQPSSSTQQHQNEEKQEPPFDCSTLILQEEIPVSWMHRFSPQYVPFDERSSYMDLDGYSKHSNSVESIQSTSNSYDRAPSAESLNIRTDEKMPAKGEISEQESNGEVDHWNQMYNDANAQYPTSYDVSQAQECWNLSQNKAEIQQFGSFTPLQLEENARENSPDSFIPKEEKDLDVEKPDIMKPKKVRSYRCHDCIRSFSSLKERRIHRATEHPVSNEPSCSGAPIIVAGTADGSESISPEVVAGCSGTYHPHFEGLSSMLEGGGLGQIVENFQIVKQEGAIGSTVVSTEENSNAGQIEDIKAWIIQPSLITQEVFMAIRSESKKMMMLYRCDMCRDEFKNLKSFNKHFSLHPLECAMCGREFTRWATFTLHLKRHFNIRDYECRLCNKTFILRQKLVEHMRVHTGIAPIQCNVCFARFRRYSNLAQHRNRHHLNKRPYKKDYVCECGETFVSMAKLTWHKETHDVRPKVCPFCRERFIHLNSLTRHIRLSHPEKYSVLKNKTVECPFCDQKYLQTSLKAHLETHSKTKNQYSCQICNKEFSTKWNLKQHQWTHANRSSKPFQCNVCPNAFVRENDYITHMNAHKSIRPYTCNHCGCQFVRKSNWMRHTREHEQEKNFTCETCNKKFHRAYYLTEHRRVHTGERPFCCNICGKTSATKTNHNKHIKIHHARDPLQAEG